jgi:hypothetical protein
MRSAASSPFANDPEVILGVEDERWDCDTSPGVDRVWIATFRIDAVSSVASFAFFGLIRFTHLGCRRNGQQLTQ